MFALLALPLFVASIVRAGEIDKDYAYEDGLSPHFKFRDSLPRSEQVSSKDIETPEQCASYASNTNGDGSAYCPSAQFTSKEVTFGDCGAAFVFCACNDGQGVNTMSIEHMVNLFSRLPPAMKQNIRYMMSMPSDAVWAQTWVGPNDIQVFGDAQNSGGALDIFLHEAGHALDMGNSSTTEWQDAVNADSCVADSYGSSNYVEEFAQIAVIVNWLALHEGPPDDASDLSCMSNQLAYFKNNPALSLAADQCSTDIKDGSYGYSRRRRSVPRRGLHQYADDIIVRDDIPVIRVAGIEGVTV